MVRRRVTPRKSTRGMIILVANSIPSSETTPATKIFPVTEKAPTSNSVQVKKEDNDVVKSN